MRTFTFKSDFFIWTEENPDVKNAKGIRKVKTLINSILFLNFSPKNSITKNGERLYRVMEKNIPIKNIIRLAFLKNLVNFSLSL
tara:strand:- start:15 stop:266 length:252 start_codon:yes stop_codon:yes gene_type:complete